jgi:hypothetical protein
MKYFTKQAFFGFGKKEPEAPSPKPYKTYDQTVESLPTYALKRRLAKLQGRAGALDEATMTDKVLSSYKNRVDPLINELRARGELA